MCYCQPEIRTPFCPQCAPNLMIHNQTLRAALQELVGLSECMGRIEWNWKITDTDGNVDKRFDPPVLWDKAIAKAKEVLGNGER